ncbi:HEPN domain-containing protein [Lentisalinibacter salinarum]|uniref:HEPN domain-containing protein n=1 Tax=Lentisalinibacter salinarum TaxID=2992239 RepID=UPI00386AD261
MTDNMGQVFRLVEIHTEIAGPGRGRKHNVEVLHKSAIVLLVAAWEAYVEDIALHAAEFLARNIGQPEHLPRNIQHAICENLRESTGLKPWQIAGEGWRNVYLDRVKKRVDHFNAPTSDNIRDLFHTGLGMKDVTERWYWTKAPRRNVVRRLDRLIDRRQDISHRVATAGPVNKKYVEHSIELIRKLSAVCSNHVRRHVEEITGDAPWAEYRAGAAK